MAMFDTDHTIQAYALNPFVRPVKYRFNLLLKRTLASVQWDAIQLTQATRSWDSLDSFMEMRIDARTSNMDSIGQDKDTQSAMEDLATLPTQKSRDLFAAMCASVGVEYIAEPVTTQPI